MTATILLVSTAAPARVVVSATVVITVALIAAPCGRPPVRPVGRRHDQSTAHHPPPHLPPPARPWRRRPGRARGTPPTSPTLNAAGAALRRGRRRTRRSTPPDEVASWCDEVARRCRSGSSLADAIVGTSPSVPHLQDLVRGISAAVQRGMPLQTALDTVDRPDDPAVHLAVTVMAASARVGGPAARALDRAAATLRLRHADSLDRAAQSAQARMSAQVLTVVPIGALALLASLDPDVRDVLASPVGSALVATGSAASALAWWWMKRIVDGAAT